MFLLQGTSSHWPIKRRSVYSETSRRAGLEFVCIFGHDDLDNLPVVPDDLSALPWATRVLVYRDAVTLALVDDEMSAEERQYLDDLAGRMALPAATVEAISSWVRDYATLLERLDNLISVPPAC